MPCTIVREHLQSWPDTPGGAAVACTGAVVFFLIVPALVLFSPLLLVLSVLSLLYHKASRLWHRRCISIHHDQNSSVVAEVGIWSVVSYRCKSDLRENLC